MPVKVEVPSANAARPTSVGASSPPSPRSRSTGLQRVRGDALPGDGEHAVAQLDLRAERGEPVAQAVADLRRPLRPARARSPGRRRRARRRGTVRRSRGRARSRRRGPRSRCAGTRPACGRAGRGAPPTAARTPRRRSASIVMSMWGREGRRAPRCSTSSPSSNRAPDSRSPDTNWLDADASMQHRAARDAAGALHGERHGAAALVVDLHPERAERQDRRRHRAQPGALVAVEPDGPVRERGERAAGSASACRRGRRRSRCRRSAAPGVTTRSSPSRSMPVPSARSASTIRSVSRAASASRSRDGPSASAESTSSRLVRLFDPGRRTVAASGPRAVGAGQTSAE